MSDQKRKDEKLTSVDVTYPNTYMKIQDEYKAYISGDIKPTFGLAIMEYIIKNPTAMQGVR